MKINKKIKKVGLVTLPLGHNIGGVLQAVSLYTVLDRMGYQPYIIDNPDDNHNLSKIRQLYWSFRNAKYKHLKSYLVNLDRLDLQSINNLHACIVGSDQVWRREYSSNIYYYYLDFIDHTVKKISYAASFGNTNTGSYTTNEVVKCKELLQKFKSVSVREKTGQQIIKDVFDCESSVVVDPTMLLESKDFDQLFKLEANSKGSPYVFGYFLKYNNSYGQLLSYISKNYQLKQKVICQKDDRSILHKLVSLFRQLPSLDTWLNGYKNSQFVLTDSFHGVVFAIIFKKPFYVVKNRSSGVTRIENILQMLGLSHRLIEDESVHACSLDRDIDWDRVESRLQEYRSISISYLQKNLSS
jgi:hypothetical protein